eukprot:12614090-Ditylum_brightwellii.AAC.1
MNYWNWACYYVNDIKQSVKLTLKDVSGHTFWGQGSSEYRHVSQHPPPPRWQVFSEVELYGGQ